MTDVPHAMLTNEGDPDLPPVDDGETAEAEGVPLTESFGGVDAYRAGVLAEMGIDGEVG